MQLTTDLKEFLPEFNMADWIPSDPSPLPNLHGGMRVKFSFSNHCSRSDNANKHLITRKPIAEFSSDANICSGPIELTGLASMESMTLPVHMLFAKSDSHEDPGIISVPKRNTFDFRGCSREPDESAIAASRRGTAVCHSPTKTITTTETGLATSLWRHPQLGYQQNRVQHNAVEAAYNEHTWDESLTFASTNNPTLAFLRTNSTVQQQQQRV
ncbi:unnamed protein product [Gongylonema pulchrum]|uniref:Uncharacterized protein n=1 Tax=Gongylonema pulchrum TaxID=637853 RepID=A0A183DNJ8_9BILA|nr:unnamed protein product [Gongylonema pulchrum]